MKTLYSENELLSGKGIKLYNMMKGVIPGGTQLLSKRPEMFAPDIWPSYYKKAKGVKIWDLDDRVFYDMSIMSVGACIIGYADDEIDEQVIKTIKDGVNSSLNSKMEVDLANLLLEMHPWFDMVRYCRSGGEAMNVAVRIARASNARDKVMFSGYHGWADWYLASNLADKKNLDGQLMPGLSPSGVPRGLINTSIPFDANNILSLKKKCQGIEKEISAIVIEPARGELADENYLSDLKDFANEIGAVLIFDEITSAFRMCDGGIHRNYSTYPDIAVFAKSLANGYAMSAILGTKKVMNAAQNTFVSSTNWTDAVGPAAAIATIKKYTRCNVDKHIINMGNYVKDIWKNAAKNNNININITGLPTLAAFSFQYQNSNQLNTFFTIEMLKRGFLGFRQFKPSYAHDIATLNSYSKAVNEIFQMISNNNIKINTPNHHLGFSRLTKE
jgi:glutamate-1-semialdehyde 2,1-aminomutase